MSLAISAENPKNSTGFTTSAKRNTDHTVFSAEESAAMRARYIERVAEGRVTCATYEEQLEASLIVAKWRKMGIKVAHNSPTKSPAKVEWVETKQLAA